MADEEPDLLARGRAVFAALRKPAEPSTTVQDEPAPAGDAPSGAAEDAAEDSTTSPGVVVDAPLAEAALADSSVGEPGAAPAGAELSTFPDPPPPPPSRPPHVVVQTPVELVSAEEDASEPDAPLPVVADAPIDPNRFSRPLPRVVAIANQKGGVGKTTTAVNLSASLAELGNRVLVIDLDPQGNASTGLGINARDLDVSIYDVLLNEVPLEDCLVPTSLKNLFVVPANIQLAGAEIELVPAFSRELRLRRAVEAVSEDFDYILIDCPPSLGLLTVNALSAASEVIVPIQCEYYALEGLGQLLKNVSLVQGNLNPRLEVSAIILTMYDARTRLADQVAAEVRTHFGDKVCRNIVPRTVRLSEAPSFGQPVIVFDPSSRGAIAYRELAKEVHGGSS